MNRLKTPWSSVFHMWLMVVIAISSFGIFGCGSGGGGGNSNSTPTTFNIDCRGGAGGSDAGTGGDGGMIGIIKYGGSEPVEVLRSGSVDASFTMADETPDLGGNALTVTTDTTLSVVVAEPAAGTPYLVANDTSLRISDGNTVLSDEPAVTGLSVTTGVTLTVELNMNSATSAGVVFSNDLINNGTMTPVDIDATRRGDFAFSAANYFGSSGSAIETSGRLDGQHGGDIRIVTTMAAGSSIYSNSTLDSSGADHPGGSGGNGGDIIFAGYESLENSGSIFSNGGNGDSGAGGNAGTIMVQTGIGHLYNNGDINADGGSGSTNGGSGANAILNCGPISGGEELRNSGAVSVWGGDAAGGDGGSAGDVGLLVYGSNLLHNAAIDTSGGNTSDPAFNGGAGGQIQFQVRPDSGLIPAGSLEISGDLICRGGIAAADGTGNGGDGGAVMIFVDASGYLSTTTGLPAPAAQRLSLVGYTALDISGETGNTGGSGGMLLIENNGDRWDSGGGVFVDDPSGDVINEAALSARGGSVASDATVLPAVGGAGGSVTLKGDTETAEVSASAEQITNSGAINCSGGDSLALTAYPGDNGGLIEFRPTNDVNNDAALISRGGSDMVDDDTLTTGFGHGGAVMLNLESLQGSVFNTGNIEADGGSGEARGGDGSTTVRLGSVQVVNSGNISASGGDSDLSLVGSIGGNGGAITFVDVDTPDQTGTLDVAGGSGETPGTDGTITP
jgi:hypothetical protein